MITLLGEPKSTNHIYKFTCRGKFPSMYMTKEGKDIKEGYKWEIKSQYRGKPIIQPITVFIKFFFGTKRKADLDNFNKIVLDSLTGLVYEDDSQIDKLVLTKHYDKERPRIEIEVIG